MSNCTRDMKRSSHRVMADSVGAACSVPALSAARSLCHNHILFLLTQRTPSQKAYFVGFCYRRLSLRFALVISHVVSVVRAMFDNHIIAVGKCQNLGAHDALDGNCFSLVAAFCFFLSFFLSLTLYFSCLQCDSTSIEIFFFVFLLCSKKKNIFSKAKQTKKNVN